MSRRNDPAAKATRNRNISRAAKERARVRTCPGCQRMNALVRVESPDGLIVGRRCRYCKIERVTDLSAVLWK